MVDASPTKKSQLKKIGDYKFDPSDNGKVGEGSFGKVYKGKTSSGKSVAIKQISLAKLPKDFETQLMREIKIPQVLDHKNIVKLIDVLKTPGNLYIISEFCKGGTLEQLIKEKGTIPESEARRYMRHFVTGYQELYEKSIIHRDIKPANLLFHEGTLKIADFGFAKTCEETNTILGTPLYMDPEIHKGNQKYDSKCDVWAAGFVFYEMLYGKVPWSGKTQYELYTNIVKNPLSFPEKPEVSKEMKELLTGMLKTIPSERLSWPEIFKNSLVKRAPAGTSSMVNSGGNLGNGGISNNNSVMFGGLQRVSSSKEEEKSEKSEKRKKSDDSD